MKVLSHDGVGFVAVAPVSNWLSLLVVGKCKNSAKVALRARGAKVFADLKRQVCDARELERTGSTRGEIEGEAGVRLINIDGRNLKALVCPGKAGVLLLLSPTKNDKSHN